jgi:hypothetical protein
VRVSIDPSPFEAGKPFRQTLDLKTGSIRIEAGDTDIVVWADANRNVYHVQIDSQNDVSVSAASDLWERVDDCGNPVTREPIDPPTQDVRLERNGNILWYFTVGDRSVYSIDLKYYDVEHMASKFPDPFRFNTFGNLLESPDLRLKDGALRGRGKAFDIRVHSLTQKAPDVKDWIEAIEEQSAKRLDLKKDWENHRAWWERFWSRSWIRASDNSLPADQRERFKGEAPSGRRTEKDGAALVSQAYNVFRFLMACQSRGRIQTKFNGGLFTQPLVYTRKPGLAMTYRQLADGKWIGHEDERAWGRRFTFQNQRLLYWPLFMSGDFEMMKPFFNHYWNLLPIRKAITKAWFEHEGAYYRENIELTGGERDCAKSGKPPKTKPGENFGQGYYHSYYFTCGLETVTMMLEYVKYTGDTDFRDNVLVPFAREILLFFDKHYERDADGKLRLDPAMVLETWWIAVNPAPDVAGLQYCLDGLLAIKAGTEEDQTNWKRFRAEIPEIYLHEINGRTAIAPAQSWAKKKNAENGELYPVFPFRCFGLGLGTEDIVDWTMRHRPGKNCWGYGCWSQDQIHWTYAGNAGEAADGLVHRFRKASTECRFPMYGRSNPDSCPDFDHFGSGSTALQRMLVQEAAGKILLLPAWPAAWDVDFRLHLERNTVISGKVTDGRLVNWTIEPAVRKRDVVVCEPQKVALPVRIPSKSRHTLLIGKDQAGKSGFRGSIGRATVFRGILKPERIRSVAAGDRHEKVEGDSVIKSVLNPKAGDVLLPAPVDFGGEEITLEAWINPAGNETGRIFDMVTPGCPDGFLVDSHPALILRVIVGTDLKRFPGVLQPGIWQHVAVAIGKRDVDVYLNGNKLKCAAR